MITLGTFRKLTAELDDSAHLYVSDSVAKSADAESVEYVTVEQASASYLGKSDTSSGSTFITLFSDPE